MQGKGLRDSAQEFEAAGCTILGISFDQPAANKAFRDKYEFPFRLLSDLDKSVGVAYHAARTADDGIARRISYLIDPEGWVAKTYKVTDTAGHAWAVLEDLRELGAAPPGTG